MSMILLPAKTVISLAYTNEISQGEELETCAATDPNIEAYVFFREEGEFQIEEREVEIPEVEEWMKYLTRCFDTLKEMIVNPTTEYFAEDIGYHFDLTIDESQAIVNFWKEKNSAKLQVIHV